MTEPMIELATAVGVDVTTPTWLVRRTDLAQFVSSLGAQLDDLDAVIAVIAAGHPEVLPYELRIGDWQAALAPAAAKTLINGTVLTTVLSALHETSTPATVLAVVVPLLFDVQYVSLSAADQYLYAVLLDTPQPGTSIDDGYRGLPVHVTDKVTEIEYRSVVIRLEDAGSADTDAAGEVTVEAPTARRLVRLRFAAPPPGSDHR